MTNTKSRLVGPIAFDGPAVAQEAAVREDNNHPPVDTDQWYANSVKQQEEMEAGEADVFDLIAAQKI